MLPSTFFLLLKLHNGKPYKLDSSNKNFNFLLDKGWAVKEKKKYTYSIPIMPFFLADERPTGKIMITSEGKSALYKSIGAVLAGVVAVIGLFINLYR